jgi:hypothetical protein
VPQRPHPVKASGLDDVLADRPVPGAPLVRVPGGVQLHLADGRRSGLPLWHRLQGVLVTARADLLRRSIVPNRIFKILHNFYDPLLCPTPSVTYLLLSSDDCVLDCPHWQCNVLSTMPESCPLECNEVIDFSIHPELLDRSRKVCRRLAARGQLRSWWWCTRSWPPSA